LFNYTGYVEPLCNWLANAWQQRHEPKQTKHHCW